MLMIQKWYGDVSDKHTFQLPFLLFFNIFGICLWGKEKAIATPGISVLVSLSCEVIDVLPLNLVSLEAVPFTKLGADSIPKHWALCPKLSLTLAVWPAVLAGVSPSPCAGEHSQDLTWRLLSAFSGTQLSAWFFLTNQFYKMCQWTKEALGWLQPISSKQPETHLPFRCWTLS